MKVEWHENKTTCQWFPAGIFLIMAIAMIVGPIYLSYTRLNEPSVYGDDLALWCGPAMMLGFSVLAWFIFFYMLRTPKRVGIGDEGIMLAGRRT